MESVDAEQEKLRLEKVYAGMGDDQLLHVAEDMNELTDVARETIRAEIERRKLSLPEVERPDQVTGPDVESMTAVVAAFQSQPEALLAQGLLQSAGIESVLADGRTHVEWMGKNAMEGIQLQVAEADADAAKEILEESAEHPLDENSPEFGEPDRSIRFNQFFDPNATSEKECGYHPSECPICHSAEIVFVPSNTNTVMASNILGAVLDIATDNTPSTDSNSSEEAFWECNACGSTWQGPTK